MGKLKLSQIEAQGSISCVQYLDQTLGKFPPLYGPHLPYISNVQCDLSLYSVIKETNKNCSMSSEMIILAPLSSAFTGEQIKDISSAY